MSVKAFMVGAGKALANPTMDVFPLPAFGVSQIEGIYDDMYVRAIAIDNGHASYVIISLPCGNPPEPIDEFRAFLSEKTGFAPESMLITCTHNHTGIRTDPSPNMPADLAARIGKYRDILCSAVVDAILQAKASLRPAKYGYGEGPSYINVNRDRLFEDGYWMQAPNFGGYSDKTLSLIKFTDYDDNLIALFMSHPTHATCAFAAKDFDGKCKTSGNFPGVASKYIEARYPGSVALWAIGAAGDQNPVYSSSSRTFELDGYSETASHPDGTAYLIMEDIGKTHAIDAIRIMNKVNADRGIMDIHFTRRFVDVPGQKPPEGADMMMNRYMADNLVRTCAPDKWPIEKKLVEMEPAEPVAVPYEAVVLGDMAIVAVGGAIYNRIGTDIKEASPLRRTIVTIHSTAPYVGYILDKEAAELNKKTFQSFGAVKPGGADEILANAISDAISDLLVE